MKSGKQRREEIKAKRLVRLRAAQAPNPYTPKRPLPVGAAVADPAQLAHNNTYGLLPSFYLDQPFVCKDCGAHEIWTAKQQKWWYEIAKGQIDTRAVRCRPCRLLERARVDEARRVSQAGMALKIEKMKKKNDENESRT
ncbi:MAG: zinc-ribbon domain-containing protein [Pseudomonadota bacterium]